MLKLKEEDGDAGFRRRSRPLSQPGGASKITLGRGAFASQHRQLVLVIYRIPLL